MVFGQTSGIFRVAASGGMAEVFVATDGTGKIAHGPQVLPGGKGVLFTLGDGANWDDAQVVIHSLETGERKVVVERGRDARYVASGHLLYVLDGTLMAVPFDVDRLEVTGGPVPMAEGVRVALANSAAAYFSVSDTGALAYAESIGVESRRTLVWVGRDGREEALKAPPRDYGYPSISPDGSRVALALNDEESDIWMFDFARETLTRFTFHPQLDNAPIWTLDGRQIVFHSHEAREGSVFVKSALGTGQAARLTKGARHQIPLSLSPDGTSLLIEERDDSELLDVSLVAFPEGGDPRPLLHSKFNETDATFAPDGRFFAFASDESGRYEIYVRPFPNIEDGSWQISRDGGRNPRWARNGRELFYESTDGKLMSVPVQIGDDFTFGNPETVIATPYFGNYDISPDGERFLRVKEVEAPTTELLVVLNWHEELKRLVPSSN
ncbi:MAG TPA: hypothetical protein VEK15_01545 [Vicinamibacteria bacterium]|nr:hypothetical protein [Vicinamibacteria bacterium]